MLAKNVYLYGSADSSHGGDGIECTLGSAGHILQCHSGEGVGTNSVCEYTSLRGKIMDNLLMHVTSFSKDSKNQNRHALRT